MNPLRICLSFSFIAIVMLSIISCEKNDINLLPFARISDNQGISALISYQLNGSMSSHEDWDELPDTGPLSLSPKESQTVLNDDAIYLAGIIEGEDTACFGKGTAIVKTNNSLDTYIPRIFPGETALLPNVYKQKKKYRCPIIS